MNILCGTDFSSQATTSCLVAAQIAKRLGDSLLVIHASEPWVAYPPDFEGAAWLAGDIKYGTWSQQQMQLLTASLRENGVSVEGVICEGFPDQVVVNKAAEVGARLIVVGSHGRRGRERWFVGSTAERVVERADRPVLVIGELTSNLQSWAGGKAPLHVAAAIDDTASSDAVVAWVAALRRTVPCDVTFIRSYWPPEELNRFGIPTPLRSTGLGLAVMANLQRQMHAKVGELPGEGKVTMRAVPTWSRFAESLAETAEEVQAHLLVVGTHQWHGVGRLTHWSVSRDLLREARLPVVCVPSRTALPEQERALPTMRRVLVPTDLSDLANRAVAYGYSLVREVGGTVELVYVVEGPLPGLRSAELRPLLSPDKRLDLERRLRELVPKEAKAADLGTRVNVIEGGSAAEVIVKLAERLDADTICMSTHGGGGLRKVFVGSVAQRVLELTRRPVFLVRGPQP